MKFVRGVFPSDGTTLERAVLAERLSSGTWLLETGTTPPRTHEPGLLLAPMHALAGTAVSLRSITLMRCNLGAALIDWLHTAGCTVTEHADLALHEMLLNAAIHGNLEVAAGASNVWAELDERQALIEIALKDPRRVARVVTVAVGWNETNGLAVVIDEGAGYRHQDPPRSKPGGEPRGSGRGLMIARAAAQVEVCDQGRCTRLIFARVPTAVG